MSDELFIKVRDITVEQLGVDEDKVTMEARFREDLEADSLDLVELIMAFEDEFGGEISDEEAQQIKTVGGAVTYLQGRRRIACRPHLARQKRWEPILGRSPAFLGVDKSVSLPPHSLRASLHDRSGRSTGTRFCDILPP